MMNGKKQNVYTVLFTGGLDSSYRLCQLAQDTDAIIQPVYLLFPNDGHKHFRPEMEREIYAQDKILEFLTNHPNTKGTLLPIKRIHRDELPNDFLRMYQEPYLAKRFLGWQYIYISLYAKWCPGVELCHESISRFFTKAEAKFYKDDFGRTFLDVNGRSNWIKLTFKDVSFPILGVTREKMKEDLHQWDYDDIWKLIWFCYQSIEGEPCGVCDNCVIKIDQGLTFLFSKKALHRYYIYRTLAMFNDKKIKDFYRTNIIYGEKYILEFLFEQSLLFYKTNCKSVLNFHFFKKLFNVCDDTLKKILSKKRKESEVYNMIMISKK